MRISSIGHMIKNVISCIKPKTSKWGPVVISNKQAFNSWCLANLANVFSLWVTPTRFTFAPAHYSPDHNLQKNTKFGKHKQSPKKFTLDIVPLNCDSSICKYCHESKYSFLWYNLPGISQFVTSPSYIPHTSFNVTDEAKFQTFHVTKQHHKSQVGSHFPPQKTPHLFFPFFSPWWLPGITGKWKINKILLALYVR